MKKKAVLILITVIMGSAGVLSPALYTTAQETAESSTEASEEDGKDDKGILEQGKEFGENLYEKMDDMVDNADTTSLRSKIREALEEMDEMGISPSVIAENTFGIHPVTISDAKKPENTLIKDAERTVRKKTEGFFTVLWNGFLDTLESMITTTISIFGGREGSGS